MAIIHPSLSRGQIYIRTINWLLCACTTLVLFYFRTSEHMEAAYGLAITITMFMTTLLLYQYLASRRHHWFALPFACLYAVIEIIFLVSSLTKFDHGAT